MIKSLGIMLALAASLPAAAMAAADTIDVAALAGVSHNRAVNADDLNLATEAGQRVLRTRVTYAVRQVCGTAGAPGATLPSDRACEAEASARAERQAQALIVAASRQAGVAGAHNAN